MKTAKINTKCVIAYGSLGFVNRLHAGMCMVQFSKLKHAKRFPDRVAAQHFIDMFGGGGYGLVAERCEVKLLSEVAE